MHDGDDFNGIGPGPVYHSVGKVTHPAPADFAIKLAVRLGMALDAMQGLFEAIEKAQREAWLLIL